MLLVPVDTVQEMPYMQADLFKKLSTFFGQFRLLHYRKHEVLFHPYDTPTGLYLVKEGYVRLFSISKDGEELTRIILGPNDLFPIRWTLANELPDYTIETLTPIEAWRAPKDKFLDYIKQNPDVLIGVTNSVLVRMSHLYKRMEYLAFGHAAAKVASILAICAEQFGQKQGRDIVIQVPLTHKDIASLVGLARETASIEMEKLEKKGIIAHRGHMIVVKNMKALNKESLLDSES